MPALAAEDFRGCGRAPVRDGNTFRDRHGVWRGLCSQPRGSDDGFGWRFRQVAELQADCLKPGSRATPPGFLFWSSQHGNCNTLEVGMKRYERKNDLGYAVLIGAIFILSVLGAVIEFVESQNGALAARAAAAWSAERNLA